MTAAEMLTIPTVSLVDNRPATTSLDIAAHFEKRHTDVMRSIRNLCSDLPTDVRERNFALTFRTVAGPNNSERQEEFFTVYFDGFILLVMGYTGKKALNMKLAYIAAFNAMREQLENQSLQKMQQLPASDAPITPDQQCTLQALVKARVESIPKAERPKGLYPQIWSRFNNHFRIARYCQLPQSRLSEAIEYLTRMDLAPALPASAPLPAPKQDNVPAWDEMPVPADLDKRRARICRELYELQEKFGMLVNDIRICLNPGGRLLRLPPELDNAYETLDALNRVATGGAYTARQAILSAYQIGKGLKFV